MTQFSLFGAEAAAPTLADFDGLLFAGGQWVRCGPQARLSVVVAQRWRADALAIAFDERGTGGADVVEANAGFGVRTTFRDELDEAARRWTRGATRVVPADLQLSVGALRLWAVAAGRRDEVGYLLATSDADDPLHLAAGAQLSRLGVAAVSLARRGGPGWRITSNRRLRRLVELLGPAPYGGQQDWPLPST